MIGLGSCIGLALIDAQADVVGLAHVVLPESQGSRRTAGQVRRPRRSRAPAHARQRRARTGGDCRPCWSAERGCSRSARSVTSAPATRSRCALPSAAPRSRFRARTSAATAAARHGSSSAKSMTVQLAGGERRTLLDFARPTAAAHPIGRAGLAGAKPVSDLLNPDQIAALFEAAKQGTVPETPATTARRGHRLRTVDFSRPTKFTNDHQRRISRAIDTFNATAATRLSAELRAQIELETINTTQLTWSAAQSQLPAGSVAVTLDVHPIGTRMMLTAEQPLVLSAIECLLGGIADRPPKERRFSEIDWTLTRRFIESIVNQLSIVWQDLGGFEPVDRGHGPAPRRQPGRGRQRADLRRDDRVPDEQAVIRARAA